MAGLESFLNVVLPRRFKPKGIASTNTFSPSQTGQVLSLPNYRDHQVDIFNSRQADNSKILLKSLFIHDPDVSAAVNAFLTVADTEPVFMVRDQNGTLDRAGHKILNQILSTLSTRFDYSKGFEMKPSIRALCEDMRYMILLRGGIGEELVFDKSQIPVEVRHVDISTLEWYETESNVFKPKQRAPASNLEIDMDIPSFFVTFFRRDPTSIYTYSPFVSSINTIAARQQVINDLYRIMQTTGFPRIEAKVMEEILLKSAPASVKSDAQKQRQYVETELGRIQVALAATRADQAFVHTDSIEMKIFNDKNPSNGLNIDSIISALNAMNQAGLRSMATILGRGESGVNTASVEARIFSMNAEAVNEPIAELWSKMLTMALRVVGKSQSHVECKFRSVELRPETELEPQMTMRAARLKEDLSLGIIDDDEYHIQMYGRIRPDASPILTGTGFMQQSNIGVDETEVSPNSDPLGRSLATKDSKSAKSNTVKKPK